MGLLALGSAVTAVTAAAASMRLRQQIAEIKSELVAKQVELRATEEQLQAARAELDAAGTSLDAAQSERDDARAALDAAQSQHDAAKSEADSLQRELDAARSESVRLQAELEAARVEPEPQEDDDRQALREAAESAEERLKQAVSERDAAREDVRKLREDGDQQEKVLREAAAWKRRAEEAEDGLRQATVDVEGMRAEIGELRSETKQQMDQTVASFEELKREHDRRHELDLLEIELLRQQAKDAEAEAEKAKAMTAESADSAEQRLAEALAERDAAALQARESADRLQRRLAVRSDELRHERSKSRRLELDLIELRVKLDNESLGPAALHLHAQIIELEARLAEAERSRRDLQERNDRLAQQVAEESEQAAALEAAEERAETAENEALSHLGTIESLELRAAEVSWLEAELAQVPMLVEAANRAKEHAKGQVADLQRGHAKERRDLIEQREAARRETQEAKSARDLPEETRAELERKDGEIGKLETKVARLEGELEGKDGEINGWKRRQEGAEARAEREAEAAAEARGERDELGRRVAELEQDVANRDAELGELRRGEPSRDAAGEQPGAAVLDLDGGSMSDLLRVAAQLLDGVEVPDAALEHADEVDKESRERWRESVIEGLHSLNEYATERGGFSGGFYEWQQRGMAKKYPFSTHRIAMRDSDATASGKATSAAREFEIDGSVDGGHRKINGAYVIQMESHLTFSGSTPNVPRIYFHDDTGGATGKVHVGFIGPHKLVPTSGGF